MFTTCCSEKDVGFKQMSQFSKGEAKSALTLLVACPDRPNLTCAKIGGLIYDVVLYNHGDQVGVSPELIDAAMRFLVRFGFAVETGKVRWVVTVNGRTSSSMQR
jgi:hypothetical protein